LLFRAGGGRRVCLWDGERISGQILDVNKDALRLRTGWAPRLELPRAAVASIEPLPGWRTVLDEDFRSGTGESASPTVGWKLTGEPTFAEAEDGTTARALVLRTAGQSLTSTLTKPLSAARVGVNFQERGQPRGARWAIELLFGQGEGTRRVAVTVAGDGESYAIDSGGLTGTARQVKQSPGWHRLLVQFGKDSLRMTCDEDVLFHNLADGPGGFLQRVTLSCQQSAEREEVRGAVAWTELCVERTVNEHPPRPLDADQDSVRLLDDDQLFGRILHIDRRVIQIEGRFGKRSLPWTEVSGCSFRRPAALPKANEGAKVRLLVRSGLCAEPDVLEGIVNAGEERRLILKHGLLGELTLDRDRVREMQPLSGSSK
jgi:hypothetical protein